MALAVALLAFALAASLAIGEPRLAGVIGAYVTVSLLYSLGLKHVPGAELAVVALASCCAPSAARWRRTCRRRAGS